MPNALFNIPLPKNEPVLSYAPGSPERKAIKAKLKEMGSQEIEIPILIGGQEIHTGNMGDCIRPHDHARRLGRYHKAGVRAELLGRI